MRVIRVLLAVATFLVTLSCEKHPTEPDVVASPVFNPPTGTYNIDQTISITCPTSGAFIFYTTDGNDPTFSSTLYSSPIEVTSSTTIKARAFLSGYTESVIASATYTIDSSSEQMVFVEGGTFNNGTSDVTVSSFIMSKYELTQEEYHAVMGTNPSSGYGTGANYPVYNVSWLNSIEYCNRRSMSEGNTPCYSYSTYGTNPTNWPEGWNTNSNNHTNVSCDWTANGYRLPTEAEWEFAARGGNSAHNYTYSGSNSIGSVAWYSSNSNSATHIAGTKTANELGLFDMSGNLWEWCWDIYGNYPSGSQTNPTGASNGSYRVNRGGGYISAAAHCTVSRRNYFFSGAAFNDCNIGWRCVKISP